MGFLHSIAKLKGLAIQITSGIQDHGGSVQLAMIDLSKHLLDI